MSLPIYYIYMRHFEFVIFVIFYISIFRIDNETKSVKTIYN